MPSFIDFSKPISLSTILSILTLIFSIVYIKRQVNTNHDNSRRKEALELMKFWNDNHSQFHVAKNVVVRLINCFDDHQCSKLWNFDVIEIANNTSVQELIDYKKEVDNDFKPSIDEDNQTIKFHRNEIHSLRETATLFLNILETVATAWRHNIADRSIIEEEFSPMILKDEGNTILNSLRPRANLYPSLRVFVEKLKEKRLNKIHSSPSKKPLKI